MYFQTMQSVRVVDKESDHFEKVGCVVGQEKGKVTVRLDPEREEVTFAHTEENPSVRAL